MAARFLQGKGYQIVETNWHCAHGELDIVAREGDVFVFVEVKTRRARQTETALTSITPAKRERLIASAYTYIADHELENPTWRIDVVAIALPRSGQPVIDHVEDALDW